MNNHRFQNKRGLGGVQKGRTGGAPQKTNQTSKDPNIVIINDVMERAMAELSGRFAAQLRAHRTDLTGLSFYCEESAKPRRIELSKLINRLKGKWKIADNAKATNFIIVDKTILKDRQAKIPPHFLDLIQAIKVKADMYVANSSDHLKTNQEGAGLNSSVSQGQNFNGQGQQHRRSFSQNLSRQNAPKPVTGVPIKVFLSWLPAVDDTSLFGRQILADDLSSALRFLESQTATFHTSRMKTVLLEREQNKPTAYSDDGAFFAVSKLISDEKMSAMQRQCDISWRQVFHEFEKLTIPAKGGNTHGATNSSGVSPAKSRVQVAVAQAQQLSALISQKASPAGCLSRQLSMDPMTVAKLSLRPQYNVHKLEVMTPNGYCPCVTKTEKQFVMQNFKQIEKTRARENYKNLNRAFEADNDIQPWHNEALLEPIPNEQHTYCQVCMESYENYMDHIKNSATHRKRAKIQDGPFAEIDIINSDLDKKKKWIHNWQAEAIVQHPIASMTGYSQFSQGIISQTEHPSVSPRYQASSFSKRKQKSNKPPTPFKFKAMPQLQQSQQNHQTTIQKQLIEVVQINTSSQQNSMSGVPQQMPTLSQQGLPLSMQKNSTQQDNLSVSVVQVVDLASFDQQQPQMLQQEAAEDQSTRRKLIFDQLQQDPSLQPEQNLPREGIIAAEEGLPRDEASADGGNNEDDDQEYELSDGDIMSSSEEESNEMKNQIRESMYKTQMHSMHKPLKEQTHFKETLPEVEESQQSEEQQQESGEAFSADDDDDHYRSEEAREESRESESDESSSDEDDEAPLGNKIAEKADRQMRGEPSPFRTSTRRRSSKRKLIDDSSAEEEEEERDASMVHDHHETPSAESSRVEEEMNYSEDKEDDDDSDEKYYTPRRVLDFDGTVADECSEEKKQERGRQLDKLRSSLLSKLQSSPRVPKLQSRFEHQQTCEKLYIMDSEERVQQPNPPHPSPDVPIISSTAPVQQLQQAPQIFNGGEGKPIVEEPTLTRTSKTNQEQKPLQMEEEEKSNGKHSYSSEPFIKELSQIEINQDESEDYPNVLTEEVRIDRRGGLDEDQISINLTPYSQQEQVYNSADQHSAAAADQVDQLDNNDIYSCEKRSVRSILTSNDKYSPVVDKDSSQGCGSDVEDAETGRFNIQPFMGNFISSKRAPEADTTNRCSIVKEEDETFGNVSFGEPEQQQSPPAEVNLIQKAQSEAMNRPSLVVTKQQDSDILFAEQRTFLKTAVKMERGSPEMEAADDTKDASNVDQSRKSQLNFGVNQPWLQSQQTSSLGEASSSQLAHHHHQGNNPSQYSSSYKTNSNCQAPLTHQISTRFSSNLHHSQSGGVNNQHHPKGSSVCFTQTVNITQSYPSSSIYHHQSHQQRPAYQQHQKQRAPTPRNAGSSHWQSSQSSSGNLHQQIGGAQGNNKQMQVSTGHPVKNNTQLTRTISGAPPQQMQPQGAALNKQRKTIPVKSRYRGFLNNSKTSSMVRRAPIGVALPSLSTTDQSNTIPGVSPNVNLMKKRTFNAAFISGGRGETGGAQAAAEQQQSFQKFRQIQDIDGPMRESRVKKRANYGANQPQHHPDGTISSSKAVAGRAAILFSDRATK